MLCAGDESGRTQQGHANAYDQDNERSWLEWELTPDQQALLDFTRAGGRPRAAPSGAAAPAFLARPAPPRVGPQRSGLVSPGWARNARGGLAGAREPLRGAPPGRGSRRAEACPQCRPARRDRCSSSSMRSSQAVSFVLPSTAGAWQLGGTGMDGRPRPGDLLSTLRQPGARPAGPSPGTPPVSAQHERSCHQRHRRGSARRWRGWYEVIKCARGLYHNHASCEKRCAHTVRCARAVWLTQEPPGGVGARPASRGSTNKCFPTGASMSPLQGWSGRRTCATNPVGCERPYRGRGVGFSGYMSG